MKYLFIAFLFISSFTYGQGIEPSSFQPTPYLGGVLRGVTPFVDEFTGQTYYLYVHDSLDAAVPYVDTIFMTDFNLYYIKNGDTIYVGSVTDSSFIYNVVSDTFALDMDIDSTNELQELYHEDNILVLTGAGPDSQVDLTPYMDVDSIYMENYDLWYTKSGESGTPRFVGNVTDTSIIRDIISDSIALKQNIITGTSGQTLRFSGTNTLAANSLLYNDGTSVGIGTTSPQSLLQVQGSGDQFLTTTTTSSSKSGFFFNYNNTAFAGMKIYYNTNDANVYFDNLYPYDGVNNFGDVIWRTTPVTIGSQVTAMTLKGNGRLGLGTVLPSQLLHVAGNSRLTGLFYDGNNEAGTAGQVLSSTGAITDWITPVTISDSTNVLNSYGTTITESPANTFNIKVDSSLFATPYDLTLINFIDSTNVLNSYGTTITESPNNTFNVKVDSTKFFSTYAGSLKENALTFTSPLSRSVNTISIPAATSGISGHLTSADWTTFNNKLSGSGANTQAAYFTASNNLASNNQLTYNGGYWNMIGRFNLSQTGSNYSVCIGDGSGNVGTSTGIDNFWLGRMAGRINTSGYSNVAAGVNAMYSNTSGYQNVALGQNALYTNSTSYNNVAIGANSLISSNGEANIGIGTNALFNSSSGYYNIGIGYQSLNGNTTGHDNQGYGFRALYTNSTGINNVAIGTQSLNSATGSGNVAIGYQAGFSESGSNTLYIANSSGVSSAITGLFSSGYFGVNQLPSAHTQAWDVNGNIRGRGAYYDATNSPGTSGQVLSSTVTGTDWIDLPAGDITAVTVSAPVTGSSLSGPIPNIGVDTTDATAAALATQFDLLGKQATLVSGTNIKTVNSNSLLGSGNVSVGTVTSITAAAPLTGGAITTSGTIGVDTTATTGSALATQFDISTKVSGSGTDNYIPRFNGTTAIENSNIYDDGTNIGIGTTSPTAKLSVAGALKVTGSTSGNTRIWGYDHTDGTMGIITIGSGLSLTGDALSASGVSDGDKGDITVSSSGAVWNIDTGVVGTNEIATDGVGAAEIIDGSVGASELASTTVTAGSYTNTNLTVDADGRITSAASGSGISDGDKGDITVSGSGSIWNIDSGVVGQPEIATNGVSSDELASNSVASVEIVDGAVALADLATIPANRLIGSSTGAANIYLAVGTGNEIQSNQLTATTSHYGFLSDANGSVTSFAINTTPVKVDFDTPLTGLSGTMTVSSASDNITVTAAGGYEINYGVCISGVSSTRQISIAIYKNSSSQSPTNKSFFVTSGDEDCASGSHIMILNASDVIDLRIATSGAETVTLTGPQLSLKRLY